MTTLTKSVIFFPWAFDWSQSKGLMGDHTKNQRIEMGYGAATPLLV